MDPIPFYKVLPQSVISPGIATKANQHFLKQSGFKPMCRNSFIDLFRFNILFVFLENVNDFESHPFIMVIIILCLIIFLLFFDRLNTFCKCMFPYDSVLNFANKERLHSQLLKIILQINLFLNILVNLSGMNFLFFQHFPCSLKDHFQINLLVERVKTSCFQVQII